MIDLSIKGGEVVPEGFGSSKPTKVFAIDIETYGVDGSVGCCAGTGRHGIAGVSLCNMNGEAKYLAAMTPHHASGNSILSIISYLNKEWFVPDAMAVFHNCKFDLGFLLKAGLKISPEVRIFDTWIMSSMLCFGIYTSNALKDIIREKFGVDTDSQDDIKNWMKEHGTEDYGEVPPEIMGKYACDDARYTLAVYESLDFNLDELRIHDLCVRNAIALCRAENFGIRMDVGKAKRNFRIATSRIVELKDEFKKIAGSKVSFLNDKQKILEYLHSKNLHPGPMMRNGEKIFMFDEVHLRASMNPLAEKAMRLVKYLDYLESFSTKYGSIGCRIWGNEQVAGIHPELYASVFSKGGIPLCRKPNFYDGVVLDDRTRSIFVPRAGRKFVLVDFRNLFFSILSYYCNSSEIPKPGQGGTGTVCAWAGSLCGGSPGVGSLLLRRMFEGSIWNVFDARCRAAGSDAVGEILNPRSVCSSFDSEFPGYSAFLDRLSKSLASDNCLKDVAGRMIRVPEDKIWRRGAILLQISHGSLCAHWLDLLCKLANALSADLVMVHRNEFLFEVDEDNEIFAKGVERLLSMDDYSSQVGASWACEENRTCWKRGFVDAEDMALHG